jgi:hypothetical protein
MANTKVHISGRHPSPIPVLLKVLEIEPGNVPHVCLERRDVELAAVVQVSRPALGPEQPLVRPEQHRQPPLHTCTKVFKHAKRPAVVQTAASIDTSHESDSNPSVNKMYGTRLEDFV